MKHFLSKSLMITFLEIFPVGLLITLVSAAILRKNTVLPAHQEEEESAFAQD